MANQIAAVVILTMMLFGYSAGNLIQKVPDAPGSQYVLLGVMSLMISIIAVVFWELL
ncbi:MAG TPA: hypothetical protein GX503_07300 [Clostridiales bacterium]|nr:hypothetical protein [Clostridiales bacterium]